MRGDWWTPAEWCDWSDSLAELIPDGDESRYSNPEGAQESVIFDCLRAYVAERYAGTEESRATRVATVAGRRYRVAAKDILGQKRSRHIQRARLVTYWLLRQDDLSYPEIGALVGRDHTTVHSGVRKVNGDPFLLAVAEELLGEIGEADGRT